MHLQKYFRQKTGEYTLARLEARTYCRELAVTPSEFYVTSEKSKIGLNLESSSEVMTERLDIIEALRRSCYRPRLSNFVVGLVLGYGWKGVDTRQLEYELGPLLPGTIKLQPLKIKTK